MPDRTGRQSLKEIKCACWQDLHARRKNRQGCPLLTAVIGSHRVGYEQDKADALFAGICKVLNETTTPN